MADASTADGSMSLEDINDPILQSQVRKLSVLIPEPHASIRQLMNAILICNRDMDRAAELLSGEGPKEIRSAIGLLKERWPQCSLDEIMEILILCAGDCVEAESRLRQIFMNSKNVQQLEPRLPSSVTNTTELNGTEQSFGIGTETSHTVPNIKTEPAEENTENIRTLEIGNVASNVDPTKIEVELTKEVSANSTSGESSRCSIKKLYELFASRASEGECENALQVCNGNIHEACELLQKSYGFEGASNDGDRNKKCNDCHSVFSQNGPDPHGTKSGKCGLKRRARSLSREYHPLKRHRSHNNDNEENPDDENAPEEPILLEPASEWVSKFFPSGKNAVILLGPEEELRDTIPKKTLREYSTYFSDHYKTAEAEEREDDVVRLPDIDPQLFDLAIQCLVCKKFTLEFDPNRSKSSDIGIILELVFLIDMLGLPDLSEPITAKLREIIIDDRTVLRRKHIKRAFELDEGHSIQKLFVQAVVCEYMKTRGNAANRHEIDVQDTDEEDEEIKHRDMAHRSFYFLNRFAFQKQFETIRAFKFQLLEEQDNVLRGGEKVLVRSGTSKKHAVYNTTYHDPLDNKGFLL